MKISSTTISLTGQRNNNIRATRHFALALMLAERKDLQSLAINVGLPVFMLLAFWLPSLGAQGEEADLLL